MHGSGSEVIEGCNGIGDGGSANVGVNGARGLDTTSITPTEHGI
jgi:hypothetical protein